MALRAIQKERARAEVNRAICLLIVSLVSSGIRTQGSVGNLEIEILEGEGAINNIKTRTAREIVVRVGDENHRPVAGALVTFTLPNDGASGNFLNGGKLLQVVTDSQGKAVARGLYSNNVAGKFPIHVSAYYNGQTGNAAITQTNAPASFHAMGPRGIIATVRSFLVPAGQDHHKAFVPGSLWTGSREAGGYGLYSYILSWTLSI
jgi:hypothetical protein